MPAMDKLVSISNIFSVSIDYLVREDIAPAMNATAPLDSAMVEELKETKSYIRRQGPYEYVSKTHIWGMPLVHVKFSRFSRTPGIAKGIIAIGDVALGVISIGGLALGLFSLGGLSLVILMSFGGIALGGFAFGGVAVGLAAVGGAAIANMRLLFKDLRTEGRTIMLASHNAVDIDDLCDTVCEMDAGILTVVKNEK